MDKEQLINIITEMVLKELAKVEGEKSSATTAAAAAGKIRVKVGVSNRHLHIAREDLDILYGKGYELNPRNPLMQPGEFATQETVTLVGPRHAIENVRILGPVRKQTQVEISQTDAYSLGIKVPVRVSGEIEGTPGLTVVGPQGTVVLKQGVMRANRHIHILETDAQRYGFRNRQLVAVRTVSSDKPTLFYEVMIRVSANAYFEMHLDTDDANAAALKSGDEVEIIL